jgi:hypothetical protein
MRINLNLEERLQPVRLLPDRSFLHPMAVVASRHYFVHTNTTTSMESTIFLGLAPELHLRIFAQLEPPALLALSQVNSSTAEDSHTEATS